MRQSRTTKQFVTNLGACASYISKVCVQLISSENHCIFPMLSESKGFWLYSESGQLSQKYKHSKLPKQVLCISKANHKTYSFLIQARWEFEITHLKHNKIRKKAVLLNCALQVSPNNFQLLFQIGVLKASILEAGYAHLLGVELWFSSERLCKRRRFSVSYSLAHLPDRSVLLLSGVILSQTKGCPHRQSAKIMTKNSHHCSMGKYIS